MVGESASSGDGTGQCFPCSRGHASGVNQKVLKTV